MSETDDSLGGGKANLDEVSLEDVACSITEFRQALSELATAAEQSVDPSLNAMPFEQVLAYISRLAAILQDLTADPDAANVVSDLKALRVEMGDTVRALHRHELN